MILGKRITFTHLGDLNLAWSQSTYIELLTYALLRLFSRKIRILLQLYRLILLLRCGVTSLKETTRSLYISRKLPSMGSLFLLLHNLHVILHLSLLYLLALLENILLIELLVLLILLSLNRYMRLK